jgi:hypothetical protein
MSRFCEGGGGAFLALPFPLRAFDFPWRAFDEGRPPVLPDLALPFPLADPPDRAPAVLRPLPAPVLPEPPDFVPPRLAPLPDLVLPEVRRAPPPLAPLGGVVGNITSADSSL